MAELTVYEQEFDDYLKEKKNPGGRLDLSNIENEEDRAQLQGYKDYVQSYIDEFRHSRESSPLNALGRPFEYIHFDLIDDFRFNGIAFRHNKHYFIGITKGAFYVLLNTFNRLLCRKDTFPEIGDPDSEIGSPTFPPTNNYQDILNFYELNELAIDQTPIDPQRSEHAATLTTLALDFLVYHEISHIMDGHIDLKGDSGVSASFLEFDETINANNDLNAFDIQTLEYDADCAASARLFSHKLNLFHTDAESFSFVTAYQNQYLGFTYNFILAVWAIFGMTSSAPISLQDEPPKTEHPPLLVRQFASVFIAVHNLFVWVRRREVLPEIIEIYNELYANCQNMNQLLAGETASADYIATMSGFIDRLNILINKRYRPHYFITMRERLKPYTWLVAKNSENII